MILRGGGSTGQGKQRVSDLRANRRHVKTCGECSPQYRHARSISWISARSGTGRRRHVPPSPRRDPGPSALRLRMDLGVEPGIQDHRLNIPGSARTPGSGRGRLSPGNVRRELRRNRRLVAPFRRGMMSAGCPRARPRRRGTRLPDPSRTSPRWPSRTGSWLLSGQQWLLRLAKSLPEMAPGRKPGTIPFLRFGLHSHRLVWRSSKRRWLSGTGIDSTPSTFPPIGQIRWPLSPRPGKNPAGRHALALETSDGQEVIRRQPDVQRERVRPGGLVHAVRDSAERKSSWTGIRIARRGSGSWKWARMPRRKPPSRDSTGMTTAVGT